MGVGKRLPKGDAGRRLPDARFGVARSGMARQGEARQVRSGMARWGKSRSGEAGVEAREGFIPSLVF